MLQFLLCIQYPLTKIGPSISKKHRLGALLCAVSFLSIATLLIFCIKYSNNTYVFISKTNHIGKLRHTVTSTLSSTASQRRLSLLFPDKADPQWLFLYIIGILYCFLALAIVCDEFFVPALEEINSPRHLNLSPDVSGATLMAAGGSAPELFTNMIGTFHDSEIGFGTIIGSAVFNVLFVISMCSMFNKEVLTLTWWPLIRDSVYYAMGLIVLAIFVGVHGKGNVEVFEAIILFSMYIGYIFVMIYNSWLYNNVTGKKLKKCSSRNDNDIGSISEKDLKKLKENCASLGGGRLFRAGVLKLLRDPESWVSTAGVGLVAKIAGDVDEVFRLCDTNGDGNIDGEELKEILRRLDMELTKEEVDNIREELDSTGDGLINKKEFTKWYVNSKERIQEKVRVVFDKFDTNRSNSIDRDELRNLLETLEPSVVDADIDFSLQACCNSEPYDNITFDEFVEWYLNSFIYEKGKDQMNDDNRVYAVYESLCPPRNGSILDYVKYTVLFPLIATLTITIPDTRRPEMGKYCYLSFIISILWIGFYSYFMVGWAEIVGSTLGIPSFIMGLTVLAAGTSVPDLLSSLIVARHGYGDMAISSSIGSNIFDILVALPLPWFLYTVWPSKPNIVTVGSDGVWVSIFILLGMLVFIITAFHMQGWILTRKLGIIMILLYLLFLAQALIVEFLL